MRLETDVERCVSKSLDVKDFWEHHKLREGHGTESPWRQRVWLLASRINFSLRKYISIAAAPGSGYMPPPTLSLHSHQLTQSPLSAATCTTHGCPTELVCPPVPLIPRQLPEESGARRSPPPPRAPLALSTSHAVDAEHMSSRRGTPCDAEVSLSCPPLMQRKALSF